MEVEKIKSSDAEQTKIIEMSFKGVEGLDNAKALISGLLGISLDGEDASAILKEIGSGEYQLKFPICCWTSGGRRVWGICDLNPLCSFRGEGCVA